MLLLLKPPPLQQLPLLQLPLLLLLPQPLLPLLLLLLPLLLLSTRLCVLYPLATPEALPNLRNASQPANGHIISTLYCRCDCLARPSSQGPWK